MADFCSQCSPFKDAYDIDLFTIALNLENGHSQSFLCEGCNNRGLYKEEEANIYLAKHQGDEIVLQATKVEELIKT